jgi:hypothetical protein
MFANPAVDVVQQLSSLFRRDAALQDLGVSFLVELPIDNGKGLSSVCEALGLYFVSGEHFTEKAVEVWCPPISLRVRLGHWFLINFRDNEDIRSQFWASLEGKGSALMPGVGGLVLTPSSSI